MLLKLGTVVPPPQGTLLITRVVILPHLQGEHRGLPATVRLVAIRVVVVRATGATELRVRPLILNHKVRVCTASQIQASQRIVTANQHQLIIALLRMDIRAVLTPGATAQGTGITRSMEKWTLRKQWTTNKLPPSLTVRPNNMVNPRQT